MAIREQAAIDGLRAEREKLIALKKIDLSYAVLSKWSETGHEAFLRANGVLGAINLVDNSIRNLMHGYKTISDIDLLEDVRDCIVAKLDGTILSIDKTRVVRSVLEELILKVKDTKLSTLLNEFNVAKDAQPNIAAIALRTILCLVIRERAKLTNAISSLATKEDIVLEPDIKAALAAKIFPEGEARRLTRFLSGGHKDTCDIVAHKAGDAALVNKDDLTDNVDLLNKLLATIV